MRFIDYCNERTSLLDEWAESNRLKTEVLQHEYVALSQGDFINSETVRAYLSFVTGGKVTQADAINGICLVLGGTTQDWRTIPTNDLITAIETLATNNFLTR